MKLRRRLQARSAFTLVELLVVMAIIVILMSLLLAGISKVFSYVDEVKTSNEESQLQQGLEAFKAHFGRYPPSRIALANMSLYQNLGAPANDALGQLERESVEFLQAIFPGIDPGISANTGGNTHNWTGIQPNNTAPQGTIYLEGEECLVFFLGGIRFWVNGQGTGFTGFCTDGRQPTLANINIAGSQRTQPFYNFDMNRVSVTGNPNTANWSPQLGGFAVYLDPYKTPYAYFAARSGTTNNYSTSANIQTWGYTTNTNVLLDCPLLISAFGGDGTAYPFVQNLTPGPGTSAPNGRVATYFRSNSFQIVSAGKDRNFGGKTMPTNPTVDPKVYGNPYVPDSSNPYLTPEATDNITNFSSGVLVSK